MKKFLKSFWIIIIAPLLVTVIGGLILIKSENVDFLEPISLFIKLIGYYILKILTLKISLWMVILIIIILFLIFYIIIKIIPKIKKNYKNYTEDYYNGLKYRWNWCSNCEEMQIGDIFPICECGCEFNYDIFDSYLICPDCNKQYKNTVDIISAEKVFLNRYNNKKKKP